MMIGFKLRNVDACHRDTRRYLTESIRLVRKFTRTLANDSAEPQNSLGTSVPMHVPHFRSRVPGASYTHA